MSDTVIKVENLGKQYRLGEIGTGTISRDIERWWARARGKEDPFAKIGQTNASSIKNANEYVWALKDVNFEVKQGEVLGIIGRNGAGKSTLLKLLSKITQPTTGQIKIRGRIASLLEVGTGFHPELTGRENVFLNGAILGMTKREIERKFDEIVDFSGVEQYIDTPVKRYSSGMHVRLAFAVAAHLEPEILIVDEVLAVGDAEFQKKCLGKMKDVSEHGRTVLFVSHNMGAIKQLCHSVCCLANNTLALLGSVDEGIGYYGSSNNSIIERQNLQQSIQQMGDDEVIRLTDMFLNNKDGAILTTDRPIEIVFKYVIKERIKDLCIGFDFDSRQTNATIFRTYHDDMHEKSEYIYPGEYKAIATIPRNLLRSGLYSIYACIAIHNRRWITNREISLDFEIAKSGGVASIYPSKLKFRPGIIMPAIAWRIVKND